MTDRWKKYWKRAGWSAIRGGAHAIAPTGTVSLMDPADWGPKGSPLKFLTLFGTTFLVSSGIAFFRYVSDTPPPDDDTKPPFPVPDAAQNKPNP